MREIKIRAWDAIEKRYYYWTIEDCFSGIHAGCMEKYAFEQYTGLHDKNGKEIYDGDILKLDGGDALFKVVFDDGAFGLNSDITPSIVYGMRTLDVLDGEVIGNIHENPELLEEKNERI